MDDDNGSVANEASPAPPGRAPSGEAAALAAISQWIPGPAPSGEVWMGDDAAVVRAPGDAVLLLSVDSVVEGVHADLGLTGVDDLGWKALAAAVSDIAAMGGAPGHALVSVAVPPGTDLESLYEGLAASAGWHGFPVVGGDLVSGPALVVTVAVTGWSTGPPVLRSGARPGDRVWLTRPVGASAAGLRLYRAHNGSHQDPDEVLRRAHARPEAQLPAGQAARRAGATAMIDISDGLATDLGHLADSSGVGIDLDTVPVARGATLKEALGGGEDYALAFCASEDDDAAVLSAFAADGQTAPTRIGRCTEAAGSVTLRGRSVARTGWEHGW